MASEKDNIIEFNQYIKPDKMPYIIYVDIESLTEKIDGCANNPKNFCKDEKFLAVKKISEHIARKYSMSAICAFDNMENKYTLYRGGDCIKRYCTSLREQSTNVINYEKEKIISVTKEELKSYQDSKPCHICEKSI